MKRTVNLLPLPQTLSESHLLIQQLSEQIKQLQLEILLLKERCNLNSSNSSLPPSKDNKKKKKKSERPPGSGRSSGGQPGHPGHYRSLEEPSRVDTLVECQLPCYCFCGGRIETTGFQRHQVYELPEIKLHLTEYRLSQGRCTCCLDSKIAELPKGVTWGITGPRLTSFMTLLVSKYQLSRRGLQELLKEHFQFSLSLGTIFNKQRLVNKALEAPVSELLPAICQERSVHIDETGHRQAGQRAWLWVFASKALAYFTITPTRGKKVLKCLMKDFDQRVVTDRYGIYNYFNSTRRQFCWSHLKRDFVKLSEKQDPMIARLGKKLLEAEQALFKHWYAYKQGQITREELIRYCEPIRTQVGECLEQGSYTDPRWRAARFCENLLTHFYALWTFLYEEEIDPTNNHAERCLRPWVIWRKKYFGTYSDYGAEYVARCASWIMTCQLQSKNAFDYLHQVVSSYFSHDSPPPFIPLTKLPP